MKQTVFRYGIYATLLIVALGMVNLFVIDKLAGYAVQEIAGYLTMLLAMIFVFAGIRHYRDRFNNGALTFGQGLKIGVLIVLIPSVFFGLFDVLYTEVLNPNWKQEYYAKYMDRIRATTSPEKLAGALAKAKREMELFSNPALQFLLMAATVFIIGLMVSVISALALRRKKTVTA
jgi:hypothetical protein